MAANGQRVGGGVEMGGPETLLGQGSLQQTGRALDLAVRGRGLFALRGTHDGIEGTYYSRDGRFGLDKDGYISNPEGLRLQGYPIDSAGVASRTAGDLQLDLAAPPRATTSVTMGVGLDANSAVSPGFDPTDPTTYAYQTQVTVYDSLGASHTADVYFVNNGGGQWEWHAMVDGGELNGGVAGTQTEIGTGTLTFNTDGTLQAEGGGPITADFIGATPGQTIALDLGDAIADGGTGLAGSSQFAGTDPARPTSQVKSLAQDGFGAGNLVDLSLAEDGTVTARFSNGNTRDVARVALAVFGSEEMLQRAGSQLFIQTNASGEPLLGAAGEGARGSISGGALEASNVDLGSELVTLIAYQRAFQANARTVTTADEMLAEIANLKR